jgi:hypothetical protein
VADSGAASAVLVRGTGFTLDDGSSFTPVGFNYDHDEHYRLLEDYWLEEWPKVETDFVAMRDHGATVIRIHLQVARFLESPTSFINQGLTQLDRLLSLASQLSLRVHLVGLGCYHRADVPVWYDKLPEPERWEAQAYFWRTLAKRYYCHPAIFCFDLMNEPVVPGRKRHHKGWLGPEFHGKCFVQFISLDGTQAPRIDIALRWTQQLVDAIKQVDPQRLVTIGLVDWSLEGVEAQSSGFIPERIAPLLDFICAHVYPEYGKVPLAVKTVQRFCLGKPLLLDETFPLRCSVSEIDEFIRAVHPLACGFMGFYTDYVSEPVTDHHHERNALMRDWIGVFQEQARHYRANNGGRINSGNNSLVAPYPHSADNEQL